MVGPFRMLPVNLLVVHMVNTHKVTGLLWV